jgi:hypothetical protein
MTDHAENEFPASALREIPGQGMCPLSYAAQQVEKLGSQIAELDLLGAGASMALRGEAITLASRLRRLSIALTEEGKASHGWAPGQAP